jgi:hypothetical protein
VSVSYSAFEAQYDGDDVSAFVKRSGLDERVWVPSIDGLSIAESECMSSTSLRRVKEYVESRCPEGKWVKVQNEDGVSWEYQ